MQGSLVTLPTQKFVDESSTKEVVKRIKMSDGLNEGCVSSFWKLTEPSPVSPSRVLRTVSVQIVRGFSLLETH